MFVFVICACRRSFVFVCVVLWGFPGTLQPFARANFHQNAVQLQALPFGFPCFLPI
jgi:hypothetical protein